MTIEEIESLLQELLRLGASAFCGCKEGCHYCTRESAIQYAEKYRELFEAIEKYAAQSYAQGMGGAL